MNKRQAILTAVSAAIVFDAGLAWSMTWGVRGHVFFTSGTPPEAVMSGAEAEVVLIFDPDAATATVDPSCSGGMDYEFHPGGASIRVQIAGSTWDHEISQAEIDNDSNCNAGCLEQDLSDSIEFSSGDVLSPGAMLWVIDCLPPYDLVRGTSIPRTADDIDPPSAHGILCLVWGNGWSASILAADFTIVAVAPTTWTNVKIIYR